MLTGCQRRSQPGAAQDLDDELPFPCRLMCLARGEAGFALLAGGAGPASELADLCAPGLLARGGSSLTSIPKQEHR